jgi:hypothetical protein
LYAERQGQQEKTKAVGKERLLGTQRDPDCDSAENHKSSDEARRRLPDIPQPRKSHAANVTSRTRKERLPEVNPGMRTMLPVLFRKSLKLIWDRRTWSQSMRKIEML